MSRPPVDAKPIPPIQDDDHVVGPDTAGITLVAYCDFECPYCGRAYPIIQQLQARFRDRLRFVFRHFPLTAKHAHAQLAAEAAEAAGGQGQFWAMHDQLFENQDALEEGDLYGYAGVLGLDTGRFERELSDRRYAKRVGRDVESGRRSGVRGTPTFFISGFRHTDEETLEDFVLRVDERRPS
jgi:protein-disulfide isomerase